MKYDAIIIGAGQAGPPIAKAFAKKGERVAVIEGDRLGGTCLNYGCLPTKALRASATTAHIVRQAGDYGVTTGEVSVDFKAAMNRMREIVGKMQDNFSKSLRETEGVDVIDGYARLVGTKDGVHQVEVNGETHESGRIYLNTGARAVVPPIDGIDLQPRFLLARQQGFFRVLHAIQQLVHIRPHLDQLLRRRQSVMQSIA